MIRALLLFLLTFFMLAAPAVADPADIEAAARGVVRVVVIDRDGGEISAISHGTGFAVGPETIVTNAHVVAEVVNDPAFSLGIVPSDGGDAVFARLVAVSRRNDLALIRTTAPMRLAPLTISGNPATDTGAVTAVGYPQNVDRAQGLQMEDLFRAQPPVKSMGFLSGRRPSREFDTLLHTAPIARGSSGGPLLDECGRVVGVNSFGAESAGTDAEFFFAVSTRELLPFLRANSVSPRINALPCRSLDDLDAAERAREDQRRRAAETRATTDERALAAQRDEARRGIEFAVLDARDNLMALSFALLVVALGAGGFAWRAHESEPDDAPDGDETARQPASPATLAAGAVALLALAGAAGAWYTRPSFTDIDARLEDQLRVEMDAADRGPIAATGAASPSATDSPAATDQRAQDRMLSCTLVPERSRVTGAAEAEIALDLSAGGCVNARTQYGRSGDQWSRAFVPQSEAAVSVNRFDPAAASFVIERYLLGREAMDAARTARAGYDAPACPASPEDSRTFGREQAGLLALLPARPNERLVYDCKVWGKVADSNDTGN